MTNQVKKPSAKKQKEIEAVLNWLDKEKEILQQIEDAKKKAAGLMQEGYIVRGYRLKEKWGNRAYTKAADLDTLYKTFRKFIPKKSSFTETKIISPAKLEKYFIENEEAREKLAEFTKRKFNGYGVELIK